MASSSAACVFGGVRLTSSASSRLVKTGPSRKRKLPASSTSWPVTSDGIRSGVNCTRRVCRSRAAATALTRSVLATPGTPSSRTWPRTRRAATSPESTPSWPTTTFPTSSRSASTASLGSGTDDLLHGRDLGRQGHQLVVASEGHGGERSPQALDGDAGAGGGRGGHHLRQRVDGQPEPLGQAPLEVGPQQRAGLVPAARLLEQVAD